MFQKVCCALLLIFRMTTHAEVFTAMVDIENLLHTQKRVILDLDFYVDEEEKRVATIKRYLEVYKKEHKKAMKDVPNYLGNPINAFTLIKRLTSDLTFLHRTIGGESKYVTMSHKDLTYPTSEDLTGAAQAIARLQKTYRLGVKELAQANLTGVGRSIPMTASDCYELGRVLLSKGSDFLQARTWMMEALRKLKEENIPYPFTETDIVDLIIKACDALGDAKGISEWTQKLLDLDFKNKFKKIVPRELQDVIEIEVKLRKEQRNITNFVKQDKSSKVMKPYLGEETYEALCRGDLDVPVEVSSRLTCRYLTEKHPFLLIAPIKIEMLYVNPDIVLFYDVLSDNEIDAIIQKVKPQLNRAVIFDPKTKKLIPSQFRTSKSSWLHTSDSEIIQCISRRTTHMTGLSMETAEDLQVANYGIGGHYVPHYDFAADKNKAVKAANRMATVLFYMTDVANGGATVFIELGVRVIPKKGTAVLWFNLHPSGNGNYAMLHAACPVLQGSKWVSTRWIQEAGQEFLKPCDIRKQEDYLSLDVPLPEPRKSRHRRLFAKYKKNAMLEFEEMRLLHKNWRKQPWHIRLYD